MPPTLPATSFLPYIPAQQPGSALINLPTIRDIPQLPVKPEPKPPQSYIGLIAMAIINSPQKQLVLSDIYRWITSNYHYFRSRGTGWKNSIRHNLSLNDCFIKSGRCANGKGHYWKVHPANVADFSKGDFRRRKAQQKVKRYVQQHEMSKDDYRDNSSSSDDDELMSPASECSSFTEITEDESKRRDIQQDVHRNKQAIRKPFDIDSLLGINDPPAKRWN